MRSTKDSSNTPITACWALAALVMGPRMLKAVLTPIDNDDDSDGVTNDNGGNNDGGSVSNRSNDGSGDSDEIAIEHL